MSKQRCIKCGRGRKTKQGICANCRQKLPTNENKNHAPK